MNWLLKVVLGWVDDLENAIQSVDPANYPTLESYRGEVWARIDRVKKAPGTLRGVIKQVLFRVETKEQAQWMLAGVAIGLKALSGKLDEAAARLVRLPNIRL